MMQVAPAPQPGPMQVQHQQHQGMAMGPQQVTVAVQPTVLEVMDQIKTTLKEFSQLRGIQSAFNAFLVHDAEVSDQVFSNLYNSLARIFKEAAASPEALDAGVKYVVGVAGGHTNQETIQLFISLLEKLVQSNVLSARLVSESLLNSEKMTAKNSKFWVKGFALIRRIIGGVDYKGVREIMKTCLEKISAFPDQVPPQTLPQMKAILKLTEHIFDRNACLLPAYFIVNELLKNDNSSKSNHWSIVSLLSQLVNSFRPIAQLVTVIGRSSMRPVVDHSGHAGFLLPSWKLDQHSLKYVIKGILPFDPDDVQPQDKLLRYILEQHYSRDTACAILGLQKQHKLRCVALEEQLAIVIIAAMEKVDSEIGHNGDNNDDLSYTLSTWQHFSTQLIFFVLFQFVSFPQFVQYLLQKISDVKLYKARDFLMWILLQFISGSIQKNPLIDFLPVLRLFDALYPEKEPLPVPEIDKPICTAQFSATCVWIHIIKKAQNENQALPRPFPHILKDQYEFLQNLEANIVVPAESNDYRLALLCNAYSTTQESFSKPMACLVDALHGNSTTGPVNPSPTTPLSVQILDSLTVHTKMSVIHNIVAHIIKVAQNKNNQNLSPALIETYARLLVYMEIESLGIKGFVAQLLPAVCKSQAWGILHTLLEMFCYRLHHIQSHYRIQLLTHLQMLGTNTQTNSAQLHLCVEMTSLRLIVGLNSVDVQSQLHRVMGPQGPENRALYSTESEELNRALVLTIARAIHVTGPDCITTGNWFREVMGAIMQHTPHNWSDHTLQCFPPVLRDFFQTNAVPIENKQQLKNMVEEEYRNWNAMLQNEPELLDHFSMQANTGLFLCIVWKSLVETDRIIPVIFRVLERIGPKGLAAHLRKFCDYLVLECSVARNNTDAMSRIVDSVGQMVWLYNIIPFDRFILCMALRTNETVDDVKLCFFLLNLLIFKNPDFTNRVNDFVANNSPEHWKQVACHEKHKEYHSKYPEVFLFEDQMQNQLPVYFGNVCLRFLPVLDILIHRFLEINSEQSTLNTLLRLGKLYKFHDRPITYLYNTLHYYENRLRDKPSLKRKLVSSILGSMTDLKPQKFSLSDQFVTYMSSESEDITWTPDSTYYASLISRFVDVVEGKKPYLPGVDWRFNEFPNAVSHVLYCTALEILSIPVTPAVAASGLLDVIVHGRSFLRSDSIEDMGGWMNAAGLILVSLPEPYWLVLHERLVTAVKSLENWKHQCSPLNLFNFKNTYSKKLYSEYANLLAITHSVWHHLGSGHLYQIQQLVTERFLPIIKNETQLLFIAQLVAPFLQRLNAEKQQMLCRLTIAFYELLEKVDKSTPPDTPLVFMDVFCDLLYHIKYMFTGDIVKNEAEARIRNLRPALQLRLRFITHLNIEDITGQTQMQTSSAPSLQGTFSSQMLPQSQQQMMGQFSSVSSSGPSMMEIG